VRGAITIRFCNWMLPNLRGLKRFEDAIVAACDFLTRIGCFEETIEECCIDMELREGGSHLMYSVSQIHRIT
jgi:hypothetical protein